MIGTIIRDASPLLHTEHLPQTPPHLSLSCPPCQKSGLKVLKYEFALCFRVNGSCSQSLSQSSDILAALAAVFDGHTETEKKGHIKKVRLRCYRILRPCMTRALQTNGIFELRVKNDEGKEAIWTIDLKKTGTVYAGTAKPKADVTLLLSDDTFAQLAAGKVWTCYIIFVGAAN